MNASILVVDDEGGIRDLLRWELSNHGHDITTASDGGEAIEMLKAEEFDVVLSDVRMPRANGLEVLRAAKAISPDTEVVVATGHAELTYAIECLRGGAFDFVQKPFAMPDLLDTIERAVQRRRQRGATALGEASHAIFSNTDPQRLPQSIVEATMRVMGADDVSLMLLDADNRLYIAHSHGMAAEVAASVRIPLGERVAGRVAATREPVILTTRIENDPRYPDVDGSGRVKSSIVYPLVATDKVVGILNINRASNPAPFRNHDLERAGVLASQVLLALENANLSRQLVTSERMASMGQLAAGVAHEITNPLTYILGMHSVLRDQLAPLQCLEDLIEGEADLVAVRGAWYAAGGRASIGEVSRAIDEVGDAASRIHDIVRDMGSLSRHDDHESVFVDLNDAIRSALRVTNVQTRRCAIVTAHLGTDVYVKGTSGRWSQVFINLLVNAAHAIAEGATKRGTIVVSSERQEDTVVVRVSDDGRGIEAKHLARIFESFFTTKGASVGTGLGLSISRDIVRGYDGDITVESSPGKGAAFTIRLPAFEL
jgi:two-component system NtrC family sensor kinase